MDVIHTQENKNFTIILNIHIIKIFLHFNFFNELFDT